MHKLRKWIRKLGVGLATIVFTAIIVFATFIVAKIIIQGFFHKPMDMMLSVLSLVIPMVVVPISMPFIFSLIINLDRAEEELRRISRIDSLTSIYNRDYILETLKREMDRVRRYPDNLSIAIIDLDDFKSINDTYGHIFGDKILTVFSEKVKSMLRATDYFGRYGGDEFLIVLPSTSLKEAKTLIRRISTFFGKEYYLEKETQVKISMSIGFAAWTSGEKMDDLIHRADSCMYQQKQASKSVGREKKNSKRIKKKGQ